MTITLEDVDGNTISAYRLNTKVAVGDSIVITGKLDRYAGALQVKSGATAKWVVTTYYYNNLQKQFHYLQAIKMSHK